MAWEKGQSGNPSGRSVEAKPFIAAVQRAIKQDDGKRLRECAEKLLDLAAAGESWAVGMLADRLDGRPHQTVDATVDHSVTVEIIKLAGRTVANRTSG